MGLTSSEVACTYSIKNERVCFIVYIFIPIKHDLEFFIRLKKLKHILEISHNSEILDADFTHQVLHLHNNNFIVIKLTDKLS